MEPTKKCRKCGEEKELFNFGKRLDSRDKLNNTCKRCKSKYDLIRQREIADIPESRYSQLKSSAKARGLQLGITMEQHQEIIGDRICFYCDANFSKDIGSGLNRCDSSKGYVLGNLKACCGTCNTIMNNFTTEQLRSRLIKIYKRLTKQEGEK